MADRSTSAPLDRKLGVGAGTRVLLVHAPPLFEARLDATAATITRRRRRGDRYDVIILFAAQRTTLSTDFGALIDSLETAGALWSCWPKRSSGVRTDLTDALVRSHGLASGLVDVKVAAIDDTWSGLKFVRRLTDRATADTR